MLVSASVPFTAWSNDAGMNENLAVEKKSIATCFCDTFEKLTLRGFIYDKSTGEPLILGRIMVQSPDISYAAVADLNGFFSISINKSELQGLDSLLLMISGDGYESQSLTVHEMSKELVTVKAELTMKEFPAIYVNGSRTNPVSIKRIEPIEIIRGPIYPPKDYFLEEVWQGADVWRTNSVDFGEDDL
jgi:hypothetical protein